MASEPKPKQTESEEKAVDFMKDAPKERPYEEAVTDEHREFLAGRGKHRK